MMVEHNQSANVPSGMGYDNKYKFNGKELDDATGMYYYGARYYDPRISIFVSVDPLAEEFVGWSPYNYTFNNPINWTDPTGMGPEDWIKNKETGEVKWFEGTKKESEQKAREHWRKSISETPEIENLGSSFFGTRSKNALDNRQMDNERESYLMDVSQKLGKEAGVSVDKYDFGENANKVTFNSLKGYFMGDNKGKRNESGLNTELIQLIWDHGGADVVQKKLPQNVLTKTFFRGLDIYLSSDNLGVGSDRQSKYKANANYEFKTKVLNVLTKEKLMKIGLKQY